MVTPAAFGNGPDAGAAVEMALNNGEAVGATVPFALGGAMVAVPLPMDAETGEDVALSFGADNGAAPK
jgi:hypothetical protein